MKKIDLGQAISIFANLGVIAGIVFLGIELQQNRQSLQAQTRSSISDTIVNLTYQQATNPKLLAIIAKLNLGQPVTEVERAQFRVLQSAYWRYRENVSYQYRIGLFDDSEYLPLREAWVGFLNRSGPVREEWCRRESIVSEDFFSEMNSLMDDPCS